MLCVPSGEGTDTNGYSSVVEPQQYKVDWSRDRILPEVSALGVPCYSRSCSEVYLEKAFDDTDWRLEARLSIAKKLGETSLMILVYPRLTEAEVEKTCEVICSVMQQAVKP